MKVKLKVRAGKFEHCDVAGPKCPSLECFRPGYPEHDSKKVCMTQREWGCPDEAAKAIPERWVQMGGNNIGGGKSPWRRMING